MRIGSGSVSMTLPSQSALTLNASTGSGKVINAFKHMPVDGAAPRFESRPAAAPSLSRRCREATISRASRQREESGS
ncbi:hypothetical protein KSC_043880 [Ktedonobacter sp. SOSP1-52]|nr:hypothetical protein KSC_043880 [Ktedonobacter sp. SOSP1-52]